jgi:hypothetical protein
MPLWAFFGSLVALLVVGGCAGSPARRGGAAEVAVRLETDPGPCTEEVCPTTDPCCHSCASDPWMTAQAPRRAARAATGELPICPVDGCGRCPFALAAQGGVVGDDFVATRWTEVPPDGCADQRCDGEGACDAVLAHGYWTWNGSRCIPFYASGCRLVGPDCARLYHDQHECQTFHAACAGK